jgi:hypothetical protein
MLRVKVEPSGEDFWKLDSVIDLIHRGGVGVIPTDTVYALTTRLVFLQKKKTTRLVASIFSPFVFVEQPNSVCNGSTPFPVFCNAVNGLVHVWAICVHCSWHVFLLGSFCFQGI